MLERLPGNLSSILRRKPITKCDLEIAQRHAVVIPINKTQQGSARLGDVIARPSRTQRDELCGKNKP
jgi:hypothetical protein